MELRRFNSAGILVFQTFLDSCNSNTQVPWPESALSSAEYSEEVEPEVSIERRQFETRFELAEYLYLRFGSAGINSLRGDTGLWAWIACYYFYELCPLSRDGSLTPGASPRWIPRNSDFRRYYRHLVAGPFAIYKAHVDSPKRAMALLCQRPGRPGDLVEQLASRQQIVTNPTIMQVATDWFVDAATGMQTKNANSKGRGGPRRLIDLLGQFDVTWDLSMMSPDGLRARLPQEFRAQAL